MRTLKRILISAGIIALLSMIPAQIAGAYWLPGHHAWQQAYVYDPAYRWATPRHRQFIRDLYRYGPDYAQWRLYRRHGW
ncbi:hypothetical protein [Thiohalocapsa sp.]|uniref:hypothetical protein n=1 Tax=Thiohalocapsa sp. TaxID=2497641 RepID=UPI0025D1E9E1|nr:hypothetical protein [Thiohalocapsa sp.]